MIPIGRSLLECTEMADHFRAFDFMVSRLDAPFDESLLKEINRLATEHTLSYRAPGAVAGEYTTEDMAAGDTVFGDHEILIARVPKLMESTERALAEGQHPLVVAQNGMATTSTCILSVMVMAELADCFQISFFFAQVIRC